MRTQFSSIAALRRPAFFEKDGIFNRVNFLRPFLFLDYKNPKKVVKSRAVGEAEDEGKFRRRQTSSPSQKIDFLTLLNSVFNLNQFFLEPLFFLIPCPYFNRKLNLEFFQEINYFFSSGRDIGQRGQLNFF